MNSSSCLEVGLHDPTVHLDTIISWRGVITLDMINERGTFQIQTKVMRGTLSVSDNSLQRTDDGLG